LKSFFYVLVWTVLFVAFGFYINFKISNFTDKYTNNIEVIEKYIEDDDFKSAEDDLIKYKKSWDNDISSWYKLLNHENFGYINLYINVLDKSILVKDKSKSLEYIQYIKNTLENILESEECDLNHIL